ncbi:signal recognition particle protein [Blattabacterium cuenoti]|uniref:signal recognition particle protein n=1 Tax=Blattabacterium cuenoti TaxID=1653831 RepID=UPI00163D2E41|nr:signal recognition particle protein [Blattabacterium cuenoti]
MFEYLQKKLDKALHILKGNSKLTEVNIAETLKDIRIALIDADVHHKIAKEFVNKVKEKSIGHKVLSSLHPSQLIIKLIYDELVVLMGNKNREISFSKTKNKPTVILTCGLQGCGKTSFSAKLAFYLKNKKYKNPLLVAADTHRAAAVDQLEILAKKINIPIFKEKNNSVDIVKNSIIYSINHQFDVIIIDTAGRLAVDKIMMDEIKQIHQCSNPDETLFIVDSMTGQDAINTTKSFYKVLNFDGIVITKLDGDSKGGVAITISSIVGKPIKFISNGEKPNDLELFYPERIANRILGMGDIVSLVEKVQEQFDEEKTKKIYKKISSNRFDFEDLFNQIQKIKKIGNIKNIISMLPGMEMFLKNQKSKQNSFKEIESMILSMTIYERRNPKILNDISRKKRIAMGSGINIVDLDKFIKQFEKINKIMKNINANSSHQQIIKNFLSKMME